MKIYLTRHGQTDYNKKRMMQGRSDIPLNEVGIAQAREILVLLGESGEVAQDLSGFFEDQLGSVAQDNNIGISPT